MMRDEVLEQVAATLEDHAERMGGWAPFVDKGVVYRSAAGVARALKSKPPEKSPEVEPVTERMQANEWLVQLHDMTKERDALRAGYDRLLAQRDREYIEAQALRTERDALRAERDAIRSEMALAIEEMRRLWEAEKATWIAEVARLKWEAAGSPMPGETPRSE